MAKFPQLGENAAVPDILKMSPEAGIPLLQLNEAVLRGPSALSEGERELIAAYVSSLNKCVYCHGVHSETAKAYGQPKLAFGAGPSDVDALGLDDKMKPMMVAARKLTLEPSSFTDDDAQAVYDAGWDEQALHDAIGVVCCFNYMNRLLEGHGVHGNEALFQQRGPMLKEHGYLPLIRFLKPKDQEAAE